LGIVEIGFGEGQSISLWQTLFPQAHVYCLDRDVSQSGQGFDVLQVDPSDPAAVAAVIERIAHPVHLIVDDSAMKEVPLQLSELRKGFSFLEHPRLGWVLVYGRHHPIDNFMFAVIHQMVKIRFRRFEREAEALAFLQQIDTAIIFSAASQ